MKKISSLLILIVFSPFLFSGTSSSEYHFVSSFPHATPSITKKENKTTSP